MALAAGLGAGACNANRNGGSSAAAADDGTGGAGATDPAEERIEIDLFAFGRVQGTIAPCGCTSVPLGGIQYAVGYIAGHSQPGRRLILEPGSLLFPDPDGPEAATDEASWAQAEQRAGLLTKQLGRFSDELVSGLGPTDLSSSKGANALETWKLPRVLTNATDPPAGVAPHRIVELGHGMRAGVLAVLDPALAERAGPGFPKVSDPGPALAKGLAELDREGVQLRVAMVHGSRDTAERIAVEHPGLDVIVVGGVIANVERGRTGAPAAKIEGQGAATWIVEPGDRGQTLTHLKLSLEPGTKEGSLAGPMEWKLITPEQKVREQLALVEKRLKKFQDDPEADAAFVARIEAERDTLLRELERKGAPEGKATAEFRQVPISCKLDADPEAKTALHEYDAWVAEANERRFKGVRPPAPAKGASSYVGREECEMCHDEAAAQWADTIHARAYQTLVDANKQFDLSCVGCHVTGFRKPGGSEVVENQGLVDVQCEQCHGAGSLHAEDDEKPMAVEVPAKVCLECHTPEHSDTFDYEAYLRDILGPGHGEKKRAALGEGPTAKQLRAAAKDKAGGGCPKM
jgi:hypothetical protein